MALYFAIAPTIYMGDRLALDARLRSGRSRPRFDEASPVVWILDAGTLNRFAFGEDHDVVVSPGGPRGNAYLPSEIVKAQKEPVNAYPIAVMPPRITGRVLAQQGMFTVHGHALVPIDDLASDARSRIRLAGVTLDSANLAFFWEDLQIAGVNVLGLFPELDSVSKLVSWLFQDEDSDVAGLKTGRRLAVPAKKKKKKTKKK